MDYTNFNCLLKNESLRKLNKIKKRNQRPYTVVSGVTKKIKTEKKGEFEHFSVIEKFPAEILVRIANNLCLKELAALSMTCPVWNDIVNFIKARRGPQSLILKLHYKYENRSCCLCYLPIFASIDYILNNLEGFSNNIFNVCNDFCPALEVTNETLFCQPRCIIIFGTYDVAAESRIGMLFL